MIVKRAATAGFCMGVSLALKKLENAIKTKNSGRICTLGPIIHNPQALAEFEAAGVVCLDMPEQAQAGDLVLIRAHGVPRDVEENLKGVCMHVEDATCPKVKKAQIAIARATAKGVPLLLFGEADHPEVAGLVSYAAGEAHVFDSQAALERLELPASAVLASQTTQDRETFEAVAEILSARLPRLKVLSTICDATRQRQQEALRLASEVEVMVVVGGRQSGNTRRLASLARGAGIKTFHVETADELEAEWFAGRTVAGLTAGASTPVALIDACEAWLADLNNDCYMLNCRPE